ncbi:40S ribosomal protein S5-1 [Hordeum vulgare]|nr:40S ribosomal protein S5-1 [Hordeum vulgare]
MHEGVLHIRDVEGPEKTGSVEARLEAMEQQVFKCQGMGEHGLNTNHMMITEFTNKHMIDASDLGKHLPRLYDRIDHLQAEIYDLQNQNYEGIGVHEDKARQGPRYIHVGSHGTSVVSIESGPASSSFGKGATNPIEIPPSKEREGRDRAAPMQEALSPSQGNRL